MKLRNYVVTWVLLLAFTVLAAEYIISEHIVGQGFEDLENEQVLTDTIQVKNEIDFQLQSLDLFLWDWASWDDTFDFAYTQNHDYIESNLQIETFQEQSLNIFAVRDNDNNLVYGKGVDQNGEFDAEILREVLAQIRGLTLPPIGDGDGAGGIIKTSHGPMFLATRSIYTSSGVGNSAGTLIMGRLVSDELLKGIASRLGLHFTAQDAEATQIDGSFPGLMDELRKSPAPISKIRNKDTISGFILIRDIVDMPAMVITVNEPRKISQHGRKVTTYTLLFLTMVLFIYTTLIVILLRRRVINRVETLNREVRGIDLSGQAMARVSKVGNDEISQLASNINAMLTQIEKDQTALSAAHDGLEKQVQARTLELQEANRELQTLDKAKSSFLSATSHELRTPLTAIHGFIKLMERTFIKYFHPHLSEHAKLTKKLATHMENYKVVHSETERLGRLIDDMLDLNKIEAGKIEWRDEALSPSDILKSASNSISGQFETRPNVDLIVVIPENLPQIYVDKDRIHQVLINLLNNAAKFTEQGHIKLSARRILDDFVEFTVEDTGIGIPKDDIAKLFEPFYQGQRDKEASPSLGTGLGLAICKEIITHYGGTIRIESEPGKGSTFIFTIPSKR